MQNLKVTLVQSDLYWEEPRRNIEMFSEKLQGISGTTDLVVLPEMFTTGFSMNPQNIAEPMGGSGLQWMQQTAARHNCIICGSIAVEDNGKYFNRFFWVRPDGSFSHYDKKHLFTYAGEDKDYTAGTSKLIVELKGWKIMPLICYDLRFPVWSRNRFCESEGFDYDVLLYVANWPDARSHAWRILLMARAIENQAYVIGVNRTGADGNQFTYSGDSAIISPRGENISNLMPNQQGIETVVMPQCQLNSYRDSFRAWADWDKFKME